MESNYPRKFDATYVVDNNDKLVFSFKIFEFNITDGKIIGGIVSLANIAFAKIRQAKPTRAHFINLMQPSYVVESECEWNIWLIYIFKKER